MEIQDLSRPWQAGEAISAIVALITQGAPRVKLELRGCQRAFPNAIAPLRAALDEFERKGARVTVHNDSNNAVLRALANPQTPDHIPAMTPDDALAHGYRFDSARDVHNLVTNVVASLSRCHECRPGVLLALEWCLNEVADNVIQHSEADGGVLAVRLQRREQVPFLALCVSDVGVGIRNSFELCGHHFPSDGAAIHAALQRGVTRDATIHWVTAFGVCGRL